MIEVLNSLSRLFLLKTPASQITVFQKVIDVLLVVVFKRTYKFRSHLGLIRRGTVYILRLY